MKFRTQSLKFTKVKPGMVFQLKGTEMLYKIIEPLLGSSHKSWRTQNLKDLSFGWEWDSCYFSDYRLMYILNEV